MSTHLRDRLMARLAELKADDKQIAQTNGDFVYEGLRGFDVNCLQLVDFTHGIDIPVDIPSEMPLHEAQRIARSALNYLPEDLQGLRADIYGYTAAQDKLIIRVGII